MICLVSYDVTGTKEDSQKDIYDKINAELAEMGARPVLQSQWAIRVDDFIKPEDFKRRFLNTLTVWERRRLRLLVTFADSDCIVGYQLLNRLWH